MWIIRVDSEIILWELYSLDLAILVLVRYFSSKNNNNKKRLELFTSPHIMFLFFVCVSAQMVPLKRKNGRQIEVDDMYIRNPNHRLRCACSAIAHTHWKASIINRGPGTLIRSMRGVINNTSTVDRITHKLRSKHTQRHNRAIAWFNYARAVCALFGARSDSPTLYLQNCHTYHTLPTCCTLSHSDGRLSTAINIYI